MLLPHRHTFFGRWLTRRLTPTGPSHLLLFLDTSAINTKLPKAVNTAEGSLRYGGGMLGGYLPRAPSPCLIPWRFCPWVPIYLFLPIHLLISTFDIAHNRNRTKKIRPIRNHDIPYNKSVGKICMYLCLQCTTTDHQIYYRPFSLWHPIYHWSQYHSSLPTGFWIPKWWAKLRCDAFC